MALQSVATKAAPDLKEVHRLLVEADSIVKVCASCDDPDDYAVIACALDAASRLLGEAMNVTADL